MTMEDGALPQETTLSTAPDSSMDLDFMDELFLGGCWLETTDAEYLLQSPSNSGSIFDPSYLWASFGSSNADLSANSPANNIQEERQGSNFPGNAAEIVDKTQSLSQSVKIGAGYPVQSENNSMDDFDPSRRWWIRPKSNPGPSSPVMERLIRALSYLRSSTKNKDALIQIWVPVNKGGRQVLTTTDQPFSLDPSCPGLAKYRDISVSYQFSAEKDSKELTGLPGRVYLAKAPEWTPDVRFFRSEEYPRVDYAHHFDVRGTLALPVFEQGSQTCLGVIEVVMTTQKSNYRPELESVCKALEAVDMRSFEVLNTQNVKACSGFYQAALPEILEVLTSACGTHGLPLAQTWVQRMQQGKRGPRHTNENYVNCVSTVDSACCVVDSHIQGFHEVCSEHHLLKGQGVAGRAFLTNEPCFSADVTSFSKTQYPLSHHARMFGSASPLHGLPSLPAVSEGHELRSIGAWHSMAPPPPFPLTMPSRLLLGKETESMPPPHKSWPRCTPAWTKWVDRLAPVFEAQWRALGIRQLILMSTVSIPLDKELMSALLCFWEPSISSFIFPFGPASITLRDVRILTGLPLIGLETACLLDPTDTDLPPFNVSSTNFSSYTKLIEERRTGVPDQAEHIEFLWVLVSRYLHFPKSGKPSVEILPLARALAAGRSFALGTILLASLYHHLDAYVTERPFSSPGAALWFLHFWAFAYFPGLAGLRHEMRSPLWRCVSRHSRDVQQVPSPLDFFRRLTERSLSDLYLRPDEVIPKVWEKNLREVTPYQYEMNSQDFFLATSPRLLFFGGIYAFTRRSTASHLAVYKYMPGLWARQFGFPQFIPKLPLFLIDNPTLDLSYELIEGLCKQQQNISSSISVAPSSLVGSFAAWWQGRFEGLASSLPALSDPTISSSEAGISPAPSKRVEASLSAKSEAVKAKARKASASTSPGVSASSTTPKKKTKVTARPWPEFKKEKGTTARPIPTRKSLRIAPSLPFSNTRDDPIDVSHDVFGYAIDVTTLGEDVVGETESSKEQDLPPEIGDGGHGSIGDDRCGEDPGDTLSRCEEAESGDDDTVEAVVQKDIGDSLRAAMGANLEDVHEEQGPLPDDGAFIFSVEDLPSTLVTEDVIIQTSGKDNQGKPAEVPSSDEGHLGECPHADDTAVHTTVFSPSVGSSYPKTPLTVASSSALPVVSFEKSISRFQISPPVKVDFSYLSLLPPPPLAVEDMRAVLAAKTKLRALVGLDVATIDEVQRTELVSAIDLLNKLAAPDFQAVLASQYARLHALITSAPTTHQELVAISSQVAEARERVTRRDAILHGREIFASQLEELKLKFEATYQEIVKLQQKLAALKATSTTYLTDADSIQDQVATLDKEAAEVTDSLLADQDKVRSLIPRIADLERVHQDNMQAWIDFGASVLRFL